MVLGRESALLNTDLGSVTKHLGTLRQTQQATSLFLSTKCSKHSELVNAVYSAQENDSERRKNQGDPHGVPFQSNEEHAKYV